MDGQTTDTWIDRQAGRQIKRQADRQTKREAERQTDRQAGRETSRWSKSVTASHNVTKQSTVRGTISLLFFSKKLSGCKCPLQYFIMLTFNKGVVEKTLHKNEDKQKILMMHIQPTMCLPKKCKGLVI